MSHLSQSPELILHLGNTKTGSSAIQQWLWSRRKQLKQLGVLYPEAGISRSSEIGSCHRKLVWCTSDEFDSYVNQLASEVNLSKPTQTVISCESWTKPSTMAKLTLLLHRIPQVLPHHRIRAIIYIRNIAEHSISLYREHTRRHNNTMKFKQYTSTRADELNPLWIITSLLSIFNDQISFRVYKSGLNIIDDFRNAICLPSEVSSDCSQSTLPIYPKSTRVNIGIGAIECEAYRVANSDQVSAVSQDKIYKLGFVSSVREALLGKDLSHSDPDCYSEAVWEMELPKLDTDTLHNISMSSRLSHDDICRLVEIPKIDRGLVADVSELTGTIEMMWQEYVISRAR